MNAPKRARWRAQAEARWPQRARAAAVCTAGDALASWGWIELGQMHEENPVWLLLVEAWGAAPAMGLRAALGMALVAGLTLTAKCGVKRARPGITVVWAVLQAVMVWHCYGAGRAIWWAFTGG